MVEELGMNKYIHTILNKYNDELKKYSPTVNEDGTTDRENHFQSIKPKIEKEFKKYNKTFLLIHIETDYHNQKEQIIITFNDFHIYYKHNGCDSCADVSVTNAMTLKLISISNNCKIIDMFDKNLTLIKAGSLIFGG